jgi:cytochrome oxidase Cu insertion factor (SCO1/SenC/PrrC family)
MQKVVVPIVAVLCIGFMGFVMYLFMSDSKKVAPAQGPVAQANQPRAQNNPSGQPSSGLKINEKAPNIIGEDVDGKEFKLSDYHGKVVMLDFWGFW